MVTGYHQASLVGSGTYRGSKPARCHPLPARQGRKLAAPAPSRRSADTKSTLSLGLGVESPELVRKALRTGRKIGTTWFRAAV